MTTQDWPKDARRDRLIGDWHIYQRTGGHRTSTDDLITAWYATHRRPHRPARYLDLGCGIGSVMLMVAHRLRPARCVGIEAQEQSARMARRAVAELPANNIAFEIERADFRDVDFDDAGFDLVTGSPPYFPLDAGVLPKDAQRRACRFEERGGVEAYTAAAARALGAGGHFFIVFQTRSEDRVLDAARAQDLFLHGRADFLMRTDRAEPFLTVFEFARTPAAEPHRYSGAVRDAGGEPTEGYTAIRAELGLIAQDSNVS